jgi:hypothetical protein
VTSYDGCVSHSTGRRQVRTGQRGARITDAVEESAASVIRAVDSMVVSGSSLPGYEIPAQSAGVIGQFEIRVVDQRYTIGGALTRLR